KKPMPIILGILVATLANHGLAGALGVWITSLVSQDVLRWVLGISFIAMAAWMLVPDQIEEDGDELGRGPGVLTGTLVAVFRAEMGDKPQLATVAMAARFADAIWGVVGTALGMMLANVPAVLLGDKLAGRIPMELVHGIAAAIFALLGLATLLGAGQAWGF